MLLSFTVLKRMRKRVATKDVVRRLRGSVSQNLILHLVRTWFGPRSHLVEIAASQNPARRGFGKALQWFATCSAAATAAAATAAAAVVACAAASEQGVVFWAEKPKASEDDLKKECRSDQRCAMGKWMKGLIGMKLNSPQKPQDCNVDHIQDCMLEMP